jgi:hypothetical protein
VIRLAWPKPIAITISETTAPASQPAPCAARHPSALRRGARGGGGDGDQASDDEKEPAEAVADARDVAPVEARVDDVQPV